ncbi:L-lactate dehydrogenase [Grosmannia clavigera kw1407]|uniref:L-lactate dehydrogenase n=1 Tax=Grosmannia clavigera (strain kw1407 / UAMH 11150) TaxID=655863 RepID=F0XU75_GROCL|nr:L-lactate dehydrogenase [Grosmannia clavigera kw1407]EFW99018.1 L-lactate dehydrogenase [Grosmannia clavigera kw1407]
MAQTQPPKATTALPLSACVSLADLEQVARTKLSPRASAYYYSAAETHTAYGRNRDDWGRISFRPRVMRDVTRASMQTQIMGAESTLPLFIAPAASAGLGHADAERCLARGAARMAIPQCVSSVASLLPRDIAATFFGDPQRRGGAVFFQLYVPRRKADACRRIDMAKEAGFEALVMTVDANVIGKRDEDDRFRLLRLHERRARGEKGVEDEYDNSSLPLHEVGADSTANAGSTALDDSLLLPPLPGHEAETLRVCYTPALVWEDLAWIRARWGSRPIIVKGIQSVEDAVEATRHGVDGIYLSNHGGRQLDYAPSAVQTLLDIRRLHPELLAKTKIYLDGGVTRGSDVVKALCLGASGVGIGRGFLFALSAYGTDGVIKAISILSDEIQTTMRLLGVNDISQLNNNYLNLSDFSQPQAKL